MTIDERLDALAMSLELTAQMQRDAEIAAAKREASADRRYAQIEQRFVQVEQRFGQIAQIFQVTHDSIARLERVATAHEERLEDLER